MVRSPHVLKPLTSLLAVFPKFFPLRMMLPSHSGYSFLVLSCAALLPILIFPVQVYGATLAPFNFVSTAQTLDATELINLRSNQEVLSFYRSSLAPPLQLSDTLPLLSERRTKHRNARSISPPSLRVFALDFTKSFALWQQVDVLQTVEKHHNLDDMEQWLKMVQTNPQWAFSNIPASLLKDVDGLVKTLTFFSRKASPSLHASEEYHAFAAFLDQRYTDLIDREDSWVHLAIQGQTEKLESRFDSYWEEFPESPLEKDSSSTRYFKSRIQSILHSRLIRLSQQIKMKAEIIGRQAWKELSTWKETWSHQRGLLRLCGTWKWIIHNHQNHADHKMTLTFPHPYEKDSSEILPATIVTIGDLVYFRWEFRGGIQEDSLLFSKKDMRLEGSFRNSTGPHGNVSGSKIKSCHYPSHSDQ